MIPRCIDETPRSAARQRQGGAALIVVMAFLTIGTMVAVSSMSGSTTNERMAGNYRLTTLAQMAAETGASRAMEGTIEHDTGTACRSLAEDARDNAASVPWEPSVALPSETAIPLGYRQAQCRHDGDDALLIQGIANYGQPATSYSLIIVGRPQGSGELPLEDYGGTITSAGPAVLHGRADVENGVHDNQGTHNVPDPRDLAGDATSTGFIADIQRRASEGDPEVHSACDADAPIPSGTTHVFCQGDFTGNLNGRLNGLTVVATGSFGYRKNKNKYEFLRIESDVSASLVAGDAIRIKGFGNRTISGLLWSGGSLHVHGRSNIVGGVVANGAVRFDGRTMVTGGSQAGGDSAGMFWEQL